MKLPSIHACVIPYEEHRFPTVGDYYQAGPNLWYFLVSAMDNPDYEFLVLIHELIEWYLTQKRGISEPTILAFDEEYERNRAPEDTTSEPGHDPKAPYHREHVFAECIERLVAQEIGVEWEEYESTVNSLP